MNAPTWLKWIKRIIAIARGIGKAGDAVGLDRRPAPLPREKVTEFKPYGKNRGGMR